jgi:Type IV secretion system pilin
MGGAAKLSDLEGVFGRVVGVAIGFAGIAFFIMFIMGGFSYLTAGGDGGKVEGAKKTLTYAIFGLVFIALSYLILVFIKNFTGVDVTTFKVTQP